MLSRVPYAWMIAATLGPASPAAAQGSDALSTPDDAGERAALDLQAPAGRVQDWVAQIEPMLWAPALDGDLRLPGGTNQADIGLLGLDDNEATPAGELHFRGGDLRISLSGFGFALDQDAAARSAESTGGLNVAAGETVAGDIDFVSVQATGGWEVWRRPLGRKRAAAREDGGPGGAPVELSLDLYGGARLYDVDASVATASGSASDSGVWIEPIVGGRVNIEVLRDFTVDIAVDGGWQPFGDHTSSSLDVVVGAQWRPSGSFGVQIGWRQILVDLSSGDGADRLGFDTSLAGLYGSLVLRF